MVWDFDLNADADGNTVPDDDTQATGQVVNWTFTTGGIHFLRATAVGQGGCTSSRDQPILITTPPVASFTSTSPA